MIKSMFPYQNDDFQFNLLHQILRESAHKTFKTWIPALNIAITWAVTRIPNPGAMRIVNVLLMKGP